MSCQDFLLGLKANYFLYPLAVRGIRLFVTLSNVVYFLDFHSTDELRIKELDINSARIFVQRLTFLLESSPILMQSPYFDMNVKTLKRFYKVASRTSSMGLAW